MLSEIYKILLNEFGHQGWWPLLSAGYHPGDYNFPRTRKQAFEICIGAILTQNTAWGNAHKGLAGLDRAGLLDAEAIRNAKKEKIMDAIKPCGYFNQKARKIMVFSDFFVSKKGRCPERSELLGLWGIGPETADSMLLYAYRKPFFVIDAYTKRILSRIGIEFNDYQELQKIFQDNIPKSHGIYNEFHALLVELAKKFCKAGNPICKKCPLSRMCSFNA